PAAQQPLVTEYIGLYFAGIGYGESAAGSQEFAAVAHLSARFRIERGLVQHDHRLVSRLDEVHAAAFLVDGEYLSFLPEALIAEESGGRSAIGNTFLHDEPARRPRAFALALHGLLEPGLVYGKAAFARDIGGEIQWKTERV